MMDLLTLLTSHPSGRHYSRLYLHPLHLRLRRKEKGISHEMLASTQKINEGCGWRSSSIETLQ